MATKKKADETPEAPEDEGLAQVAGLTPEAPEDSDETPESEPASEAAGQVSDAAKEGDLPKGQSRAAFIAAQERASNNAPVRRD